MFEGRDDLLAKIQLGEDSLLELKAVRFRGQRVDGPSRDDLADELAAMANTLDSVIVFGVDDRTREILGVPLERLDAVETFVRDICQDSIKPPLSVMTTRLRLPDAEGAERVILKVDVPRSLFVHKSPGGYFHRVGSSKREMTPELLARLFQQRSQSRIIRFDEQVVPGATLDDLDRALCERFRGTQSFDDLPVLLDKLAMVRRDGDVWRPSVAGVLLGTLEPRRFLPNAFIQAVAYRGVGAVPLDDPNYQVDAQDLTGPLDQQIREACRFVFKNMRVSGSKTEGRVDSPQFDMTAVFEAIVNAVAHRDYSIYGAKIRLRVFADRLELYSPGTLPNTMTIASLPFRQAARNEAIGSLLAKCPVRASEADISDALEVSRTTLMDRRGEGVSVIMTRGERSAGRPPVYRLIDDAEVMLTLYGAPERPDAST